jgi:uncharacterized protein YjbJ (UPF0337 family)
MAKTEKPKAAEKAKTATGKAKTKADKAAEKPAKKPKSVKSDATVEGAKAKVGVVKGKVEKAAGKATGNKKLEARGQADESGAKGYGKVQKVRKKLRK